MGDAPTISERFGKFCWNRSLLDRRSFLLLSWLLELHQKQQKPIGTGKKHLKSSDSFMISSSSEDESNHDDTTTGALDYSNSVKLRALKRRLLDRLAELMARVKLGPESQKRNPTTNASHVAAALLVETDCKATIYVSKNEGLDVIDRDMLKTLGQWIRLMANLGQRPAISMDPVWQQLLRYYISRIIFYMKCFRHAFAKTQALDGQCSFQEQLLELDRLCAEFILEEQQKLKPGRRNMKLSDAVSLAYELRLDPEFFDYVGRKRYDPKLKLSVCYLGRLRGAYETFKEAAMHFASFKDIEIIPIQAYEPQQINIDLAFITGTLDRVGLKAAAFGKSAHDIKHLCSQRCFVHAEIQLVLETVKKPRLAEAFPYIGISKKTCFLCARVLNSFGGFGTRGSHGKVLPLWTVPEVTGLAPRAVLRLESTILEVQKYMETRVGCPKKVIPHEADSSIGLSIPSGGLPTHQRLRRTARTAQRLENAKHETAQRKDFSPHLLGKQTMEVDCIRIPADGSTPHLNKLSVCEAAVGYACSDSHSGMVPSFQPYWGMCQFERGMKEFEIKGQKLDVLNGLYRIYWTHNCELRENQYLKDLLLRRGFEVSQERLFFCGDVFVVGIGPGVCGEGYDSNSHTVYRDLSADFIDSHLIKTIFSSMWEQGALENHAKQDSEMEQDSHDHERARDIFLAKMSKAEQEVLRNDTALLEHIMILEGETAEGSIPTGITYPADRPGMVEVHSIRRKSMLDRIGWEGFKSDDL